MTLNEAANVVSTDLESEGVPKLTAFDPSMILLIISTIIELLSNCKKPAPKMVDSAKSPSFLDRWAVKRAVKLTLDDKESFKTYGKQMVNSILSNGANLTETQMSSLMEEAQNA